MENLQPEWGDSMSITEVRIGRRERAARLADTEVRPDATVTTSGTVSRPTCETQEPAWKNAELRRRLAGDEYAIRSVGTKTHAPDQADEPLADASSAGSEGWS